MRNIIVKKASYQYKARPFSLDRTFVILCSNSLTVIPTIIAMSTELYSKTVTGLALVFRRQTVALGHDEKVKPPAFAELVGLGFWVSLFNGRCS